LYKAKDYPAALELFQELRGSAEPRIADGSLLHIGRILARTGKEEEAKTILKSLVERPEKSERFRDASYELALIFFNAKDYLTALPLLVPLEKAGDLTANDARALRLLARTRLALGTRYWREYRAEEAQGNLSEAVRLSEVLLGQSAPQDSQASILALQGEAYAGLAQLAKGAGQYNTWRRAAETALAPAIDLTANAKEKERLQGVLSDVRAPGQVKLQGSIEAVGGGDWAVVPGSSFTKPGAFLDADLSLLLPLGWRQLVIVNGVFTHDDFSLKTAYYPAGQPSSAARILERTDTFSISVDWQAGSRRTLFSDLGVSGEYTLAELAADNSLNLRASEQLSWRQSAAWKFGLGLNLQYLAFPNYTSVSGRGLDYLQAAAGPEATWYLSPDLNMNLGYDFSFRQFLNSKYDQLVSPGSPPVTIPAVLDKQYFTHGLSLTLRASPGTVVRPLLGYSLVYNKTVNYDDRVSGLPTARFVPGKGDYIEHRVRVGSTFNWTKDFSTVVEGSLASRAYATYLAQDASGTFTGAVRSDLDLHLDGKVQYVVWKQKANGIGDLTLEVRVSYRDALSNHTYAGLVQANYQSFEAEAGALLRLP
jgi:hypothetical protein